MAKASAVLLLERDHWRLVEHAQSPQVVGHGAWSEEDLETATEMISQQIVEQLPKAGNKLALLLDDCFCLTARFQMESAKQARKREALLYKLEELIPLAAEDVAAAFVRRETRLFALAVERSRISPFVESLQARNIDIELVAPLSSLAWQQHLEQAKSASPQMIAWFGDASDASLLVVSDGIPKCWQSFSWAGSENKELVRHLSYQAIDSSSEGPLVVYTTSDMKIDGLLSALPEQDIEIRTSDTTPLLEQALNTLNEVSEGRKTAAYDLTSEFGTLKGNDPLRLDRWLLLSAFTLLILSLIIVNVLASRRANQARAELLSAQEDVWREAFPDTALPRSVRSRLESELAKLSGLRVATDGSIKDESVLPLVGRLLRSLPEGMRFRILEIRVEDQKLDITGEVRDFGDADRIAAALRAEGFQVKPPTTRRLPEQGVGFRLQSEFTNETEGGGSSE